MLIRFTDDYVALINLGYAKIADIHCTLHMKEPYVGGSPALDGLYAHSIAISAIIDTLCNDDNSDPKFNEGLWTCLRGLVAKNICSPRKKILKNVRNLHETSPVNVTSTDATGLVNVFPSQPTTPGEDTPYIDGNSVYQQNQN